MTEIMKDSKTRWLGQIPADWDMVRVKDCFDRKNKKANQKDPIVLSLARSGVKIRDISSNEGQLAADYTNYNPVAKDDILINPMDLVSGDNCNISRVEGVISPAYVNLRYKKGINPRFYNYYFKLQYWLGAFFAHGFGVSFDNRWTLSYETLSKYPLVLPPSDEQDKIADFLDEKCAEIDQLSEDVQKQISILEEYKKSVITRAVTKGLDANARMRDSGVDWLGLINGNWEISKIKYVCDFGPNCKTRSITDDTEISYEPMEFIKNGYFQNNSAKYSEIPKSLTPFEDGDIVIAKVTPCFENGNIAIMNNLHSGIGFGSSELFVLRAKRVKTKFLFYWLQSSRFVGAGCSTMTGVGGLKRVSPAFFRNSEICLPSEDTQEEIVSFLDGKIREIDSSIETKNQQINNLLGYKKSIIYEYVTGKKRVA